MSPEHELQTTIDTLRQRLGQRIIGQHHLLDRLLIALLADGHLLVEGAPGLAKTRAIKALAECISADFQRIQFTPDLLPSDITGSEIYRPQTHSFEFQPGPIFHNLILADEINRAPAKVQSALLEAMAERQVTVGGRTRHLPELFLVMATQNPIEQEGTYPLPEAQLDRFLMLVRIDYPTREEEQRILQLTRREALAPPPPGEAAADRTEDFERLSQTTLKRMREAVLSLHMDPAVERYLVDLVISTRTQGASGKSAQWLDYGASPRATIALDRCARAHAWLQGKDFVAPEDIRAVAADVLRHRLILGYQAQAEGVTTDRVVQELLDRLPMP